jgi:hypothetical protein
VSSYLSSHTDIADPKFTGHVWRDGEGAINATVDITPKRAAHSCWLCFDDPADARAVAAACTEAADAMERLEAEGGTPAPEAAGTETTDG